MARRNLPPEAEAWGRSVDEQLANMSRELSVVKRETANAFKGINGALSGIANQVQALDQLTAELRVQQDVLSQQQATLTQQQNTLSAALTDLAETIAKESTGRTYSDNTGSAQTISSGADYASLSFSVPAGYTRAYVMAVSSVTASGSGVTFTFAPRIQGQTGYATYCMTPGAGDAFAQGSNSHARTLTGLSGGNNISVSTRITNVLSGGTVYAVTTAFVVYTKE